MKTKNLDCKTENFPKGCIQVRGTHRYFYVCEGIGKPQLIKNDSYRACQEAECFNLRKYEITDNPVGWEE